MDVVLVVDMANVVGSRPDGWWRDRVGANARLAVGLAALVGHEVVGPDAEQWRLARIVAVVEGQANRMADVGGVQVVRSGGSGDDAIAATAHELAEQAPGGDVVVVATSDKGLRERLPARTIAVGSGWLRRSLDDVTS